MDKPVLNPSYWAFKDKGAAQHQKEKGVEK
jgi:hypothetical protein